MAYKIKLHIFFATLTFLFGWYYLVDSLPRSRLIPDYLDRVTAAADAALAAGRLEGMAVEQPMFYLDNPVVAVAPAAEGGYEIRFAETSRRRCEQLTTSEAVKRRAARVVVDGGSCRDNNLVTVAVR